MTAATLKTEVSRKGTRSKSKKRDRPAVGSGAERPAPVGKSAVGQKTPVPVKGPAPVTRPAPDPKVGTFVVREDSEI